MVAIAGKTGKRISEADRFLYRTLAGALATLAGVLESVEYIAPDHFHAPGSHLVELLAVVRDAQDANRRKLGGVAC